MSEALPSGGIMRGGRRSTLVALILALVGIVAIVVSTQIGHDGFLESLLPHRHRIIAGEIAFFGIIIVELLGRQAVQYFRRRDALQFGLALRATLRTIAYLIIAVSIVSTLSANPALAVGVGSVTGVVIGFSAQNIIGNLFAGMFLAIGRPFRIGDNVTVGGVTGKVVEIGIIYTILDSGERWVFVPSMTAMTSVVQRDKKGGPTPDVKGS